MSAVFGRSQAALSGLCAGIVACRARRSRRPAHADAVDVPVDQARIMKLPDGVATIVIGNPLIADAALQAGGMLVVTGKGYGSTNMLALDRTGARHHGQNRRGARARAAPIWSWSTRASSANPTVARRNAQRRITLGDSAPYFAGAMSQGGARTGGAAASGAAAAPH